MLNVLERNGNVISNIGSITFYENINKKHLMSLVLKHSLFFSVATENSWLHYQHAHMCSRYCVARTSTVLLFLCMVMIFVVEINHAFGTGTSN